MRAEHAADEAEHDHEHHHHDHDHEHEHEHEHEHHHDHDHECDDPSCSCHHHHHHADEVFTSWGKETPKVFTRADIERILTALDSGDYGRILRAKGIVNGEGGRWIEFDFVRRSTTSARDVRTTPAGCASSARSCRRDKLAELFGL